MMDRVRLTGIRVQTCHGVLPAEKRKPQWFRVDVDLHGEFEEAARLDELPRALDYSRVHEVVCQALQESCFDLIEALARHLCARVLQAVSALEVEITVTKENPPIAGFAGEAAVTMRRDRAWLERDHG